jgi:hypothetical protein
MKHHPILGSIADGGFFGSIGGYENNHMIGDPDRPDYRNRPVLVLAPLSIDTIVDCNRRLNKRPKGMGWRVYADLRFGLS